VKCRLKSAEDHVASKKFRQAVIEASIAKVMLFSKLSAYVPSVDKSLTNADRNVLAEVRNLKAFGYIANYLAMLRDLSIISLLGLSLSDFSFLNMTLFAATKSLSGEWQIQQRSLLTYDQAICTRQISCLVDISIRIEGVV
jgi:hypothetical protein